MNKTIETIYPLTFLQQRLLIHGLVNKKEDQGFIQVTCKIKGPLNPELLKESWKSIISRHAAFRTSIHWENIEKPVQVVHPEADFSWQYLDFSKQKENVKEGLIETYLQTDEKLGFDFSKAPISRYVVIKIAEDEHRLIWSCHHILFDGWSGKVALQQVFECYDNLCSNVPYQPPQIPDYNAYAEWISRLDHNKAKSFWTDYLKNFENPTLLSSGEHHITAKGHFKDHQITIPRPAYDDLKDLLRKQRVTLSTFLNAAWGMLLGAICNSQDVVFGATVSGRSMAFPHLEKMIGLFMNVLPVRVHLPPEQPFVECMRFNQQLQSGSSEFEYVSQDLIGSWIGWKSNLQLFDTLVITQNLMASHIGSEQLTITDVKGKVTTTHPLTIVAEPGKDLHIILKYDSEVVDVSLIEWVAKGIADIVNLLVTREQPTVKEFQSRLEKVPEKFNRSNGSLPAMNPGFSAPTNSAELELTKIWEELIGKYPIGIDDNFFDIGGDSFMALQLISKINREMNRKASPMALIQHPTIRSMVKSWRDAKKEGELSSLVPMRASGDKPPLFVIHGGGGHIFFYYPLTKYLDKQQPVYALQPVGLFGEGEKHRSIEEMAQYYLETIKRIIPNGPFSILGTCLSDPICVEINNRLQEIGEAPMATIIVDSSPIHLFPRKKIKPTIDTRIDRFKQRYNKSPYKAIRKIFVFRLIKLIRPFKRKWKELKPRFSPDKEVRELFWMQQHLMKLYNNYQWKQFDGRITFIKTTQNKNWDEEVWQNLAKRGVKVIKIPGEHYRRFEEPNVIAFANFLQEELDRVYEENLKVS